MTKLGFDPASVAIEVWTEFLEAPQPGVETRALGNASDLFDPSRAAEPERVDQRIDFGPMSMELCSGRAFSESEPDQNALIRKEWKESEGRRFLIESARYVELAPLLESLPVRTAAALESKQATSRYAANAVPPQRSQAGTRIGGFEIAKVADATSAAASPRAVLDYVIVNTTLNGYTFQGDTTYYLSSAVTASGTTTFEGGAVLKYAANASLTLSGMLQVTATALDQMEV